MPALRGARWRAPGVPGFAGDTGSSRRRHGCHWNHAVLDRRRLPPRRSFACDAPAGPRGRAAGHFTGVVLVDAVKSHQRIQNQQPRPEPLGCLQEPRAVPIAIEPEHGRGDHVNRDPGKIETAMAGHSRDAFAHDQERVLGQVDQDRPRLRHGVLAQARRASRYAQGHVQPQPCLGALGGATDHTHRTGAPQPFHKPALGTLLAGNLPHAHDRKRLIRTHRHLHTFTFFLRTGRDCLG